MAILATALLLALPSLAATSLALFPTGGGAAADQRTALDAALRKALEADDTVTLQSASETRDNVKFMAEGGALCTPSDLDCLQKFGLVATVDQLLVAEARGRRVLEVSLSLVDVADGKIVRTVAGTLTARDSDAVNALVQRALHGEPDDDDDKDPAPAGAAQASPTPPAGAANGGPAAVDAGALRGLQRAGVWTAGIGGGVAGLGLLGALGGEAVFWTGTGAADVRGGLVKPLAQTMWFVAIAGVVAAGAGGGLYLAGSGAPPDDQPADSAAAP
jgi:hypothetical protein